MAQELQIAPCRLLPALIDVEIAQLDIYAAAEERQRAECLSQLIRVRLRPVEAFHIEFALAAGHIGGSQLAQEALPQIVLGSPKQIERTGSVPFQFPPEGGVIELTIFSPRHFISLSKSIIPGLLESMEIGR